MPLPMVAIVGRPNVGKSTLFNRLVGRRQAIVADEAGTTRDRITAQVDWEGHLFTLVDTGGLEPRPQDPIRQKVKAQVEMAAQEADVIILLVDAAQGLHPMDQEVAQWLRLLKKPVVLAANKADSDQRRQAAAEFYQLGLGDPIPISAYHDTGIYDLMDAVLPLLPPSTPEPVQDENVLKVAIVGRPNVGKSTLLNTLLGQERAIVSEVPGTTRDALDTLFTYKGQPVLLIDTAGVRRRGRVQPGIEKFSVLRVFRAVERADVVFLVLDATELATSQDAHVGGEAWESHKGVIIVINKWDLAPPDLDRSKALTIVRQELRFMAYAPVVFVSALKGQGITELMDTALEMFQERRVKVSNKALHKIVMEAMAEHPPPSEGRRRLRVYRVTQEGVSPPTFSFAVNDPALVHFSYQRFLENRLRAALSLRHTRPKLVFKGRQ